MKASSSMSSMLKAFYFLTKTSWYSIKMASMFYNSTGKARKMWLITQDSRENCIHLEEWTICVLSQRIISTLSASILKTDNFVCRINTSTKKIWMKHDFWIFIRLKSMSQHSENWCLCRVYTTQRQSVKSQNWWEINHPIAYSSRFSWSLVWNLSYRTYHLTRIPLLYY